MPIDFTSRNPGPELMDGSNVPQEDLFQNYRELHVINKYLGGYRITLKGIQQFNYDTDELSVLDVGSGGGDMLNEVSDWGRKKHVKLHLTGIDLSPAAISYSAKRFPGINWIQQDVFEHLKSGAKYDVIMSTLFMHHFSNEKIAELLKLMWQSCNVGIVVNDLHRYPLAYHSIRLLTKLFSGSYLVKHDAPMSVLRGFKKNELTSVFEKAHVPIIVCKWEWAFRYLVVMKK